MTDQNREVVATDEYESWGNVLKSDRKDIAADNPMTAQFTGSLIVIINFIIG
ncbi:hypothetical protein PDK11_25100 [Bacillus cereus]|nr:hypothetical protein [Bacillus cereus]